MMNVELNSTCHSDRSGGIFLKELKNAIASTLDVILNSFFVILSLFLGVILSLSKEIPPVIANAVKRNEATSLKRLLRNTRNDVILLGALLLFTLPTFASIQDDYQKANALYNEGNYEEAITTYESILNNNNIAPDIYYNLGNAYYKNNQIPPAILNYERALKLKPDHEDALFNLKMANKKTVDKVERLPELFITNSWRNLVTSRTVSDWAYYTVALVFLALLFFIIYLLTNPVLFKKISFYSGSFFLVLSLFCWLMASQHQRINASSSEAIIFEPTVTIQSEPNTKAEKLFTLHEGTKVTLLEKVNDWSKIKLPNGNVGWVVSSAIEAI